MSILNEIGKNGLTKFLTECAKVVDINIDTAFNVTLNCIKAHDGKEVSYESIKEMKDLEIRWYESLEKDSPDYSVYSDPYYFCEVWMCWVKYSRRYLKDIQSTRSMGDKSIIEYIGKIDNVIDLGCGFGYTTAGLNEIYPDANVYGTNIVDSYQYKMAVEVERHYGFSIVGEIPKTLSGNTLIFASEYFEHFEIPIEHLNDVIATGNPKYLLIANTFNGKAIGHFNTYKHLNESYDGKTMNRMFNNTLREHGYNKVKTKCWNNRPTLWERVDQS